MTDETLDERSVERDPLKLFKAWFDSAVGAKLPLPRGNVAGYSDSRRQTNVTHGIA